MEVRPDYKQTEVGVIPVDWHAVRLGEETTKVGSGITPTGGVRVYKEEGRPFLRSQNVGWGSLILDDVAFIDDETHATFRGTEIEAGDVLLNITGASIGRTAVADARVERGNVNQHVCIIRTDQAGLHPRFLNYFLLSTAGQKQIDSFQAGGNRQGLNFGQVRSFWLPLPAPSEQEAIAGTLSDADALIETLEQLLAKKRQLKQGAMQELLTGKKRLPGFSAEWEAANLDSVVDRITGVWGANDSSPDHPRPIDIIRAGDISQGGLLTGSAQRFLSDMEFAKAECRLDDILITTSGAGLGKAWWCDGRPSTAASNFIRILRPRRGRSTGRYLSYVLRTEIGLKQLQEHTATSAYPNLRPSFFAAPWLSLPPISEQMAIATILSDMDAEIVALRTKLAKARQLKQGMMQELLTGRIRLV